MGSNHGNLVTLSACNYENGYKEEANDSTVKDVEGSYDLPPLESDEEKVKERKRLKILTLNKK